MSERLSSWVGKRRESKAVELMQIHLSLTTRAVEELEKTVEHKVKGQTELANKSIARISRMEEEADGLRREIALELTRGQVPPLERDDLLHLSRDIDWITDWSKESALLLAVAPVERLPERLTNKAIEMTRVVKETAIAVRECVNHLNKEPREAMKLADSVEALEERVDSLYTEIRGMYPTIDFEKVNPGEVYLIGELFDAIENITDWCENTIDQVRIIAVRSL